MSHERTDASVRVIVVGASLLVAGVLAALGGAAWWYRDHFRAAHTTPAGPRQTSFTTGPSADPAVVVVRRQLATEAAKRLESYGWSDREQGIAQIPIERAMSLFAAGVKPPPAPAAPGQTP